MSVCGCQALEAQFALSYEQGILPWDTYRVAVEGGICPADKTWRLLLEELHDSLSEHNCRDAEWITGLAEATQQTCAHTSLLWLRSTCVVGAKEETLLTPTEPLRNTLGPFEYTHAVVGWLLHPEDVSDAWLSLRSQQRTMTDDVLDAAERALQCIKFPLPEAARRTPLTWSYLGTRCLAAYQQMMSAILPDETPLMMHPQFTITASDIRTYVRHRLWDDIVARAGRAEGGQWVDRCEPSAPLLSALTLAGRSSLTRARDVAHRSIALWSPTLMEAYTRYVVANHPL